MKNIKSLIQISDHHVLEISQKQIKFLIDLPRVPNNGNFNIVQICRHLTHHLFFSDRLSTNKYVFSRNKCNKICFTLYHRSGNIEIYHKMNRESSIQIFRLITNQLFWKVQIDIVKSRQIWFRLTSMVE